MSKQILVHCKCGSTIHVDQALAGKKGRCPECNAVNEVPNPEASGLLHFADEVIADTDSREDSWSGLSSVVEVDLAKSREMQAKHSQPSATAASVPQAGLEPATVPAPSARPAPFRGPHRPYSPPGKSFGRANEYGSSSDETHWRVTLLAITTVLLLLLPLGPQTRVFFEDGKLETETVGMVWTWDLMDGAAPLFTFMVAVTVASVVPAIVQISASGLAVSISKAAGGFVCLVIILAQAEKVSGPLLGQQGPLALPGLGRHRAIAALGMLSLAAFVVAGHVRNRLGHPRPARITQGIAGLVFASVGACQLARAGGQLNMTSVVMILMLLAWLTTLAGGVLGGLNGLGILRRPAVMDTLGLWLVYGGIAAGLLIVLASCPGAGGARFWAWLNVFRGLVLPLTLVYLLLSGICGIIVDSAIKLSEARPA